LLCALVFALTHAQVGKAADVYSLGIILWEMVTGSQPYKDLDEGE
jgi:serine/threonine protein kinase